jgi:pyruvate formate lyase activating enzyme
LRMLHAAARPCLPEAPRMFFGGIQKTSCVDYPGKMSAVLFARGCNFACPYCHNPGLSRPEAGGRRPVPDETTLWRFLEERRGFLDAVVISGGEPTLQPDLPRVCGRIRAMGYAVKVDTNGSRPEMLEQLVASDLVDYLAMDVKTDPALYPEQPGLGAEPEAIRESIRILIDSGRPHEFRTTCCRPFVSPEIVRRIAGGITGAMLYALQPMRASGGLLRPDFFPGRGAPCSKEELGEFRAIAEPSVRRCIVRAS